MSGLLTGAVGPTGAAGAAGATGSTGATGPAPSGTGLVRVTAGVIDARAELSGDVTTSGALATTIAAAAVTLAKMANLATATFIGRTTAGTGVPEALTVAQATALLNAFTTTLKGLVPSPGSVTSKFLRDDGTWTLPGLAQKYTYLFCTGTDGALVFDGSATVLGMAPVANVYTMTKDIYPTNMTVNTGVTVKNMGYAIMGNGTLTLTGTGKIVDNGNSGSSFTGGAARAVTTSSVRGAATLAGASSAGNAANSANLLAIYTTTAAAAGGASGVHNGTNGARGQGGGGGGGSAGGGSGGGVTAAGAGGIHEFFNCWSAAGVQYTSSTGGGGGGPFGASTGGGAGASGGVVPVAFPVLAGSGTIECKGGNGAQGLNASAGGGGGGGGGNVIIIYVTNGGITFTAAGGTGGAAGGGSSGAGGDGGAGYVLSVNLSGDGT